MYIYIYNDIFCSLHLLGLVISPQQLALAINTRSTPEVNFMNVNNQRSGEALTVTAGQPLSLKCSGLGNGAIKWSWEFTNFYTELTGYSQNTGSLTG